ncbi:hypothetical protein BGX31_009529 [Mortierella sp. GBA43]|nr:hypothetical protein BGX31_009529 [Mortierella sp. GBA43]
MLFRNVVPSPKSPLSPRQILDLASVLVENAFKTTDENIALVLCQHAEVALSQVKDGTDEPSDHENQVLREKIATVYYNIGKLLEDLDHPDAARMFFKKSEGGSSQSTAIKSVMTDVPGNPSYAASLSESNQGGINNARVSGLGFTPPGLNSRLLDTRQLACSLRILQIPDGSDEMLDTIARDWLQVVKNEPDEHDRLTALATNVIRSFKRDDFKDPKVVTEVAYLAPVIDTDDFRYLFKEFCSGIEQSTLLDAYQLEGVAQLIQGAEESYLDADDLAKVLDLISTRLQGDDIQQSVDHLYQSTLAVSYILDVIADVNVKGLDCKTVQDPFLSYLEGLKKSSDPYLVYQAGYTYQALLYVPENESIWKTTLRRTGKAIQGISVSTSPVERLDLNKFINGLEKIQQELTGGFEVVQSVKHMYMYEGAKSLSKSGQEFFKCLQEGLGFDRKCAWYPALRGADIIIQDGRFSDFKTLVYEAPCRHDAAFQWGVCQRLGEIASCTIWDGDTRQCAIALLGEMYRNDAEWGQHATIKQWILDMLMQLRVQSKMDTEATEALLQELRSSGDSDKQAPYQACHEDGPGSHPLKRTLPAIESTSLLNRVQERLEVEEGILQLRSRRLTETRDVVYIPLQAKHSSKMRDETRFPLMEKVQEFLTGHQAVFLLLGDSGAGKSTFNRQLELTLWRAYESTGPIPLYIDLPTINKPEHGMIEKHLKNCGFTEPQIQELKEHRTIILICDGYDESQQTQNLYTSNRLNEEGEWSTKMIISCRSEYLGAYYRDLFQPGYRGRRSGLALFQEAVITSFSWDQVQDYIDQYVSVHRPLWEANEYKRVLGLIPSLKELVKSPFLMSLSLDVLPMIVNSSSDVSSAHVTRVELYDQFIKHRLEKVNEHLERKNPSFQEGTALESLSDIGFVQNGVSFLKRYSLAIYKYQDGQPIVQYSRLEDENAWKSELFGREEDKPLCEACLLEGDRVLYRFIHRSLLEYGIALAVFDPQDRKERVAAESVSAHQENMGSTVGMDVQGSDFDSPLVWRCFVNEPLVLQFLEERAQQEPVFRQQLLDLIEQSKNDSQWDTAASNAITILVRAGVQFNGADLRGIRVPKADLSYGVFDSAQLQGADLRQVDLRGAWLQQADLSNAELEGARFGELRYTQHSEVLMCTYAPDGRTLAVALFDFTIIIYSTSTCEKLWTKCDHRRWITSIVYSPKNNQLASGSQDMTVRLWDIKTGECSHVLTGHKGWIQMIAYSPGGDQVASASEDKSVKLWDVVSGQCLCTLAGHTKWVYCVAFSPNQDQIATSSEDMTVRLWDVETEKCSHILSGHTATAWKVAYSPTGSRIASASHDKTVRLWDVATGKDLYVLEGHACPVFFLVYSAKGDQVASACRDIADKSIRLWDTTTGVCVHTLHESSHIVLSIAYSPFGDLIAVGGGSGSIRLWDTEAGMCRQTLNGHTGGVWDIAFSPKGDQLASGSHDQAVRLWNVRAGSPRPVAGSHSGCVQMVKYSPKSGQVATCGQDSTARLWDMKTGTCRHIMRGHSDAVFGIAFSPRGDHMATGGQDRTVRLWDVDTGVCNRILTDHSGAVHSVAYSPEGDQLASASEDRTVRLWDVATGRCLHILSGHTDGVTMATYSPTGHQIVSRCNGGSMRLWSADTKSCIRVLDGHGDRITSILYSPQGELVVSATADKAVSLWDVATGDSRCVFSDLSGTILCVAYSPKHDQVAYGCKDGPVKLLDVVSGAYLHTLDCHYGAVQSIAYSPQGDLIVSASADKTMRLWDAATGQCRSVIRDIQSEIHDVAWVESSGSIYLVAGARDGSVGMWQVRSEGDQFRVNWCWRWTTGELSMKGVSIQDARGLNQVSHQLFKQHGAVGDPVGVPFEKEKVVRAVPGVFTFSSRKTTMGDRSTDAYPASRQLGPIEDGDEF